MYDNFIQSKNMGTMKMKGIHIIQISYSLLGVVFLVLTVEKEKTNRLIN